MNAITHQGETIPFTTVAELLALPHVRRFLDDPQFHHWAYDGLTIYAVDSSPVMHLVGVMRERIVLPRKLQASQGVSDASR